MKGSLCTWGPAERPGTSSTELRRLKAGMCCGQHPSPPAAPGGDADGTTQPRASATESRAGTHPQGLDLQPQQSFLLGSSTAAPVSVNTVLSAVVHCAAIMSPILLPRAPLHKIMSRKGVVDHQKKPKLIATFSLDKGDVCCASHPAGQIFPVVHTHSSAWSKTPQHTALWNRAA